VDWQPIACSYQFVLIAKPYDARRIAVPTSVAAENESAALLSIDRQPNECDGRSITRRSAPARAVRSQTIDEEMVAAVS
jgi:hypothetical protein